MNFPAYNFARPQPLVCVISHLLTCECGSLLSRLARRYGARTPEVVGADKKCTSCRGGEYTGLELMLASRGRSVRGKWRTLYGVNGEGTRGVYFN